MSYSLSFSKAILVIIFVADKMVKGQYEFLSTASISKILNIPKPTLVKILQSLNTEGIIQTKEGKLGGVRLMKEPSKITVLDVFNAIERKKPLFHTSFDIMAKGKRPDNAQRSITKLFSESESHMKDILANKSIAQIQDEMSS